MLCCLRIKHYCCSLILFGGLKQIEVDLLTWKGADLWSVLSLCISGLLFMGQDKNWEMKVRAGWRSSVNSSDSNNTTEVMF